MRPGTSDSLLKKWFFAALWCIGQLVLAWITAFASAHLFDGDDFAPVGVFLAVWLLGGLALTIIASNVHQDAGFTAIHVVLNILIVGLGLLMLLSVSLG